MHAAGDTVSDGHIIAGRSTEECGALIDALHKAGLTDGRKPRTYRVRSEESVQFSKSRKKTNRSIKSL